MMKRTPAKNVKKAALIGYLSAAILLSLVAAEGVLGCNGRPAGVDFTSVSHNGVFD